MKLRRGDVVRVTGDTNPDWPIGSSPAIGLVGVVVDMFDFGIPGSRTKATYYTVRMFVTGEQDVIFEDRLEKIDAV